MSEHLWLVGVVLGALFLSAGSIAIGSWIDRRIRERNTD